MKTWIVRTRAVVRREYIIAAETAGQAGTEAMLGDVPWDSEAAVEEELLSVYEADGELLEAANAPSREQTPA
jgi:hypothetical protein